jgi:hypothetical protein
MAKRGRPQKNELQPPWMLGRMLQVLYAYNEARCLGFKHSVALTEVVATVKKRWPSMRISETEVKRILAQYQPRNSRIAIKVVKKKDVPAKPLPPEVCSAMRLPEGYTLKHAFSFGFGPRPQYPRTNSRTPQEELSPAGKNPPL